MQNVEGPFKSYGKVSTLSIMVHICILTITMRVCTQLVFSCSSKIAQLRHRKIRLRYVCHADEKKRVLKKNCLSFRMSYECEALLRKLKTEFTELMDVVHRDTAMMNEWKHRNRSGGAYQYEKERFEREVAELIQERIRIRSYAAR